MEYHNAVQQVDGCHPLFLTSIWTAADSSIDVPASMQNIINDLSLCVPSCLNQAVIYAKYSSGHCEWDCFCSNDSTAILKAYEPCSEKTCNHSTVDTIAISVNEICTSYNTSTPKDWPSTKEEGLTACIEGLVVEISVCAQRCWHEVANPRGCLQTEYQCQCEKAFRDDEGF